MPMIKLDRFMDTRAKRSCLFRLLYLLLVCWILFTYLQTARILISIDSYDRLFAVLGEPAMERSYGSRLILLGMSQPSGTVLSMAVNAVRALRMENILFLIAWFCFILQIYIALCIRNTVCSFMRFYFS